MSATGNSARMETLRAISDAVIYAVELALSEGEGADLTILAQALKMSAAMSPMP